MVMDLKNCENLDNNFEPLFTNGRTLVLLSCLMEMFVLGFFFFFQDSSQDTAQVFTDKLYNEIWKEALTK